MYGVLYAVTPELFPTHARGTGNALVAVANRVFGIMVRVVFSGSRPPAAQYPLRIVIRRHLRTSFWRITRGAVSGPAVFARVPCRLAVVG
jgi:hypothetical protein